MDCERGKTPENRSGQTTGGGDFEAYYNRDSVSYSSTYGLDKEVETIIRGTLRYEGWCESVDALTRLGFLDTEKEVREKSYASLMKGLDSDRAKEFVLPRA